MGAKFEAHGQVQAVRENGLLVGLSVMVGVFENEQLVIRLGVARFVVRVTGHGGNPKPPLVVEGELDRIGEIGKLFVGCKELDPVAFRHRDCLGGILRGLVAGSRLAHVRQGLGSGIAREQIQAFP